MTPLNPPGNPRFMEVLQLPLFSGAECEEILGRLDPTAWVPASVTAYGEPGGAVRPDVRSVLNQKVPMDATGWPLAAVREAIEEANAATWRFDLRGFTNVDHPNVLLYEAGTMDHFTAHMDAGDFHPTRKLSFSVQLSDPSEYRGGDLLFPHSVAGERERGIMTVFPSITLHEVTPVISGRRYAMVGWVHGPTFR